MWDGQMPRGNWMPDPRDGKCGKMPHSCPGGGGGWALLELTDALFVGFVGQHLLLSA